jgi:rRNA biogenesis protein RRP5
MKILGQIVSVEPLALIVSLPNQLFAHVPITNISSQLTSRLESSMDEDDEEEEEDDGLAASSQIPDLSDIFQPGQYVRAVVTTVHAPGSTDTSGLGKSRDQVARASRRVELSLVPERVNAGVQKSDLKPGFVSFLIRFSAALVDIFFGRLSRRPFKASKTMGTFLT